jgi:hypothetical protein
MSKHTAHARNASTERVSATGRFFAQYFVNLYWGGHWISSTQANAEAIRKSMSIMPSSDKPAMVVVIRLAGSLDAKTTANAAARKME